MKYFKDNIFSLFCISAILFLSVYVLYQDVSWRSYKNFSQWEKHIAIILDVSKSMNIIDMSWESRLTAAKKHIISQVQTLSWYKFSLSVFAWESQRILPFTSDINLLGTFLLWLDYRNVTQQGTDIDAALSDASESFLDGMTWDIFLYTDGDESDLQISSQTLEKLSEKELIVHIVPVGTEKWGFIPSWNPLNPYKVYNWKPVQQWVNIQWLESLSSQISWKLHDFTEKKLLDGTDSKRWSSTIPIIILLIALLWGGTLIKIYFQMYPKLWKE